MHSWKKLSIYVFVFFLMAVMTGTVVSAAGPSFKDSVCAACHNDAGVILPKAPHPASDKETACAACHAPNPENKEGKNYGVRIHKIHQGEKTNVNDCFTCHPQ